MERGRCLNTEITAGDPCAALHSHLLLKPGETIEFSVAMGIVEGREVAAEYG